MIIPLWVYIVGSVLLVFSSYCMCDRRGGDRMVVGFTRTSAISAYTFNHTNINYWHYSGTSRYCPPYSGWVAPWTYISLPIPADWTLATSVTFGVFCIFMAFLLYAVPSLASRMSWYSSETKEIDELPVLFVCLFCFSCIYINVFDFAADIDIF